MAEPSAQQVAGAMRRLMETSDWSWRYHDGDTPAEQKATQKLRAEARQARAWLLRASEQTPLRLPMGNGINGPWQRIPCVTSDDRFGIVDIAAGWAVEFDAKVPSYVKRFAERHNGKACGPNQAAGCAPYPEGWRQVQLLITDDAKDVNLSVRVPRPLALTWGLTTCYGHAGCHPLEDGEHRQEAYYALAELSDNGIQVVETDEPQEDEIKLPGFDVSPDLWAQFWEWKRSSRFRTVKVRLAGSNIKGRAYVRVTGPRPEREQAIDTIRAEWLAWVEERARKAAAEAAERVYHWGGAGLTRFDRYGEGPRIEKLWGNHQPPTVEAVLRRVGGVSESESD